MAVETGLQAEELKTGGSAGVASRARLISERCAPADNPVIDRGTAVRAEVLSRPPSTERKFVQRPSWPRRRQTLSPLHQEGRAAAAVLARPPGSLTPSRNRLAPWRWTGKSAHAPASQSDRLVPPLTCASRPRLRPPWRLPVMAWRSSASAQGGFWTNQSAITTNTENDAADHPDRPAGQRPFGRVDRCCSQKRELRPVVGGNRPRSRRPAAGRRRPGRQHHRSAHADTRGRSTNRPRRCFSQVRTDCRSGLF
jgi:hypothetical protein